MRIMQSQQKQANFYSMMSLRRPPKPPSRHAGGEGTLMLAKAREQHGWLGFVNAYWGLTLFNLSGRAFPVFPCILYSIYAVSVVSGCILSMGLDSFTVEGLSSARDLTTIVGLAVFLLLSFRNQAAYMRWWDGARNYYEYLWIMQEMACQSVAMYSELYPDQAEELIWWIIASIEAAKAYLRQSEDYEALLPLMPRPLLAEFLQSKNKVLFAWYKFNKLLVTLKHASTNEVVKVHPVAARAYAYCVHIYHTPFPFVYLSHMRSFIYIWLATVPWVFVGHFQWWTILVCIVIAFGVLGVEEAAVEVEQPFGTDYNDLPLDHITSSVYESLKGMAELIGNEYCHSYALSDEEIAKLAKRGSKHTSSFEREASGLNYFARESRQPEEVGNHENTISNGNCSQV